MMAHLLLKTRKYKRILSSKVKGVWPFLVKQLVDSILSLEQYHPDVSPLMVISISTYLLSQ